MSSHRTSPSPHLPPPTVPPDFATLPSSSSSPLGKEQLGTSAVLQEDMVLSLVPGAPWSCQSCAPLPPCQEGRKKGLAKGWPCLPPLRSSLGNTSGSSRSAQTNVSSTAGASGRGREGKKQEGNRQAVTRESVGTRRDALHYDLSAFSSPSSTSLPDPPRDLQLGERHSMNLCVHTQREAPPPKVSCCLSQQERPQ